MLKICNGNINFLYKRYIKFQPVHCSVFWAEIWILKKRFLVLFPNFVNMATSFLNYSIRSILDIFHKSIYFMSTRIQVIWIHWGKYDGSESLILCSCITNLPIIYLEAHFIAYKKIIKRYKKWNYNIEILFKRR